MLLPPPLLHLPLLGEEESPLLLLQTLLRLFLPLHPPRALGEVPDEVRGVVPVARPIPQTRSA